MCTVFAFILKSHIFIDPEVISNSVRLSLRSSCMLIIILTSSPISVVGIETSSCWQICFIAEPKMPFTNHVGVVAQLLEMLRQKCQVGEEASGFLRPENSMLTSSVYGISASHQGGPGGGADGLDVALLQDDPGPGQEVSRGQVASTYLARVARCGVTRAGLCQDTSL